MNLRTIRQTLNETKQRGKIALVPFIPAGYPDLETTGLALAAMDKAGASVIEIGIPFSDPIADGPIIQEAYTAALAKKIRFGDILKCIAKVRGSVSAPLIAMASYSMVYRFGQAKFLAEAKEAGLDGLILPDLPPPEAEAVCQAVWKAGLETILLVAPTSDPTRRKEITSLCTGFVYYLSVAGITGERDQLPVDLDKNIAELRKATNKPICVGFGISQPRHVAQLTGLADGAIVGSAIVRQMKQNLDKGPAKIAGAVGDFCRHLLQDSSR